MDVPGGKRRKRETAGILSGRIKSRRTRRKMSEKSRWKAKKCDQNIKRKERGEKDEQSKSPFGLKYCAEEGEGEKRVLGNSDIMRVLVV